MTTNSVESGEAGAAAKRIAIPILVGVIGKRKDRLAKLQPIAPPPATTAAEATPAATQ